VIDKLLGGFDGLVEVADENEREVLG
jgi:hypothetical protein